MTPTRSIYSTLPQCHFYNVTSSTSPDPRSHYTNDTVCVLNVILLIYVNFNYKEKIALTS